MIKKVLITLLVLALLGVLATGTIFGAHWYVVKKSESLSHEMRYEEVEQHLRFFKSTEVTRYDISQNYLGGRYGEDLDAMDERIIVYSFLVFSFIVIYDEEDEIYLHIESGF